MLEVEKKKKKDDMIIYLGPNVEVQGESSVYAQAHVFVASSNTLLIEHMIPLDHNFSPIHCFGLEPDPSPLEQEVSLDHQPKKEEIAKCI